MLVSDQVSVWLLRDDVGDAFNALLEKFLSLSYSTYNKVCCSRVYFMLKFYSFSQAEETALMAKLTLHSVYGRFRADMFLSSLTESSSYPSRSKHANLEVAHPFFSHRRAHGDVKHRKI
jgi:hypothetical protein